MLVKSVPDLDAVDIYLSRRRRSVTNRLLPCYPARKYAWKSVARERSPIRCGKIQNSKRMSFQPISILLYIWTSSSSFQEILLLIQEVSTIVPSPAPPIPLIIGYFNLFKLSFFFKEIARKNPLTSM